MSEARTDRLEEDVGAIKAAIVRLEPMINRIDAVLPHLATKEELADLRGEMRTGFADLRGEMRTGFADLQGEMRSALAGKPSHAYLWGVMGAMVGGQAVILAAAALALVILQAPPRAPTPAPHVSATPVGLVLAADGAPPREPYSCRLFADEQRKCAFGSCDQRTLERLRRECVRDGGRP